ncbi:MAG: type II toxin-antitoxin system VapC family toxin [Isosphaeraceae bacterium]|nr:type II toxin-antitoxin system VapC family toxin [Isosphaeraceae bacterium]
MAAYFFDTSAIVKRHIQEKGTSWVRALTGVGTPHQIFLARITAVEVCAAVTRRQRSGSLAANLAATILTRFRRHVSAHRYHLLEVTPGMLMSAMTLAETQGLRAYDAVQLAAAVELNSQRLALGMSAVTLISADHELNAAALACGLRVDDPNLHP